MFIPLGQTMVHLPQSMQLRSILTASFSFPRCRQWRTFLRLMPENAEAGQVALHEPHAMHFLASGSISHRRSNNSKSTSSMFTAELGDILKPKSIILQKYNYEFPGRPNVPRPRFPEPFSVRYMPRHRIFRPWMKISHWPHCPCF